MNKKALLPILFTLALPCQAEEIFTSSAERDSTSLGPRLVYPKGPKAQQSAREFHFNGGQVNAMPYQSPAQALEIIPGLVVQ